MLRRTLWTAALGLMLVGCSTTTVTGSPAEKILTKAELYDPCTLPVTSLQALGLDPKPIGTDFFGVPDPEWHLCIWSGPSFFLTVLSTTNTLRKVRENPRNVETRELTIAGRQAITYYDMSDPSRFECDVTFATEEGVVAVRARVDDFRIVKKDPCVVAQETTVSLNKDFPQ